MAPPIHRGLLTHLGRYPMTVSEQLELLWMRAASAESVPSLRQLCRDIEELERENVTAANVDDLRLDVLGRLSRLTSLQPAEAEDIVMNEFVPLLLRPSGPQRSRLIERAYDDLLLDWLERLPPAVRMGVRDHVLQ